MMNYFLFIIIITILFIIYVEYSVGGILFRLNSLGQMSMNLSSLLYFMIHPLTDKLLWNIHSLDINYPFVVIFFSLLYYLKIFITK